MLIFVKLATDTDKRLPKIQLRYSNTYYIWLQDIEELVRNFFTLLIFLRDLFALHGNNKKSTRNYSSLSVGLSAVWGVCSINKRSSENIFRRPFSNKGLAAACRFKQGIALIFAFVRSATRTNCIGSGNADCAGYTGNVALAHAFTHSCGKVDAYAFIAAVANFYGIVAGAQSKRGTFLEFLVGNGYIID